MRGLRKDDSEMKNNKTNLLYKASLLTCLITLVVCVIFKIFGAKYFDLNTSLPLLIEIDKIIMNNFILTSFYSMILCSVNLFFILGIIFCQDAKTTLKMTMKYIPLLILLMIIKYYTEGVGRILCDFVYLIIVPVMENKIWHYSHMIKRIIITILLNIFYQSVSLFIKNLGFSQGCYGFSISILFMVDYYIMLLITYMVSRRCDLWTFQVSSFYQLKMLWKKHMINLKQSLLNRKDK